MKNQIIYSTMTGHSKKIANAISKKFNIESNNIKDNPILENIDVLFIVSGIYGDKSSPDLIEYLKGISKEDVKKVFLITSSCSSTTKANDVRKVLSDKGIKVLDDEIVCRGGFLFFYMLRPNKSDISNIIEKIKIFNKK